MTFHGARLVGRLRLDQVGEDGMQVGGEFR
jgi:hypothetical protein